MRVKISKKIGKKLVTMAMLALVFAMTFGTKAFAATDVATAVESTWKDASDFGIWYENSSDLQNGKDA